MWRERTKDYEQIYKEGVKIIKEIRELSNRQKQLDLGDLEYSILLTLEKKLGRNEKVIEDAKRLSEIINQLTFPGWITQTSVRRRVEAQVRRYVRKYIKKAGLSIKDVDELHNEIIKNVKSYAA